MTGIFHTLIQQVLLDEVKLNGAFLGLRLHTCQPIVCILIFDVARFYKAFFPIMRIDTFLFVGNVQL